MRSRVVLGIQDEAIAGLNAVPRRGAEVGGILLGSRSASKDLVVDDFEPLPSEHRYGPSYLLSRADRSLYQETVDYFRSEPPHGLGVIGCYRTHTRPDFALTNEDRELFNDFFPNPADVFLLIRPSRAGAGLAVLYERTDGRLVGLADPVTFPFSEAVPPPAAASRVSPLPPPPQPVRGPTVVPRRRRSAEMPRWAWIALVAGLTGAGGILGYVSLGEPTSSAAAVGEPRPSARPITPDSPPPAPPARHRPAQAPPSPR